MKRRNDVALSANAFSKELDQDAYKGMGGELT